MTLRDVPPEFMHAYHISRKLKGATYLGARLDIYINGLRQVR
jgi:hypothetical protein